MPLPTRPLLLAAAVVTIAGIAPALPAVAAPAYYRFPTHPTGVHVTAASGSSITVAAHKSRYAQRYRLYASTVKSDLFYDNLIAGRHSSARHYASASRPSITLSGLHYTTAPYYYRFEAVNGPQQSFSTEIFSVGLRPATPTRLAAASSSHGTYLTWSSGAATGFRVAQATNSAMTANRRTYEIRGPVLQFTPYGLTRGRTYWFRVRALNSATPSSYTAPVALTARARMQPLSVVTYNILQLTWDGTRENGKVIAPWSRRGPVAAALIKRAYPDVVAVQEGWPWAAHKCGPRQVDSLRTMLADIGAEYYLARTEIPPCERGYGRRGDYILYKASAYQSVHGGGVWDLGDGRNAAWQELQNRATGARVLVVCAHLTPPQGRTHDLQRQRETQTLLRLGSAKARALGVPVVYAGDFNSDRIHAIDAPADVMRAAHIDDARAVAQSRSNTRYDSMNQYRTTPPAYGLDIDYVWAPGGTAVTSWTTLLNLSHGHWVGTIPSDHNPVMARLQIPY